MGGFFELGSSGDSFDGLGAPPSIIHTTFDFLDKNVLDPLERVPHPPRLTIKFITPNRQPKTPFLLQKKLLGSAHALSAQQLHSLGKKKPPVSRRLPFTLRTVRSS
jgi:hypothetical protein